MAKQKKRTSGIVWLRRGVQTFFLFLFLTLFVKTTFYPPNNTGGPVTFFFNLDPLVLIATWIATYAVPVTLLLSLITIIVTLLFGRWFCGWVCPFGALHNLFTSLRPRRLKDRIETSSYTPQQKTKYYILIFCILSALMGFNTIGWLDPFSFLFRSLSVAVYPAISNTFGELIGWLYSNNPGIGSFKFVDVVEPVYDFCRDHIFPIEQPFYLGSLFIGILFVVVLMLNLFKARFWCRYICPLGALLGVIGKNPVFRLVKNPDTCNQCRLCLDSCQGGAEPHKLTEWKPSECFYCWNCDPACPHESISFKFEIPKGKKS